MDVKTSADVAMMHNGILSGVDAADFRDGLKLDLASPAWGGKGWQNHPDAAKAARGMQVRDKSRTIRIHKDKPIIEERIIAPAISLLTSDDDMHGRTMAERHARVKAYEDKYDRGLYPISGKAVEKEPRQDAMVLPELSAEDGRLSPLEFLTKYILLNNKDN